jgi:prevent-host-death family protein
MLVSFMARKKSVKVSEMKAHFSAYLKRASKGERITVTDRDRPIAELGPLPKETRDPLAWLAERTGVQLGSQDFSQMKFPLLEKSVDAQGLLIAVRED